MDVVAGFGTGAYSLAEAGRLLDIPSATLRHWLFGYRYDHHGPEKRQEPLWHPQYGMEQEEPLLGFRDLLEARIVRGLRGHRMGLPVIRECLRFARELVGDEHPFSTRQFKTDGRRLFLDREGTTIDLKLRQNVFRTIVEPSFLNVDFNAQGAVRWWPMGDKRAVVLDPARSFGQPIVASGGVSTARLAETVLAEGSVARAAHLFDITPTVVRDALAFERRHGLPQPQGQKLAA